MGLRQLSFVFAAVLVSLSTVASKAVGSTIVSSQSGLEKFSQFTNVADGKEISVVASNPLALLDTVPGLKMGLLFLVWYSFNAAYNVFNGKVKKGFAFPWFTSTAQLGIGMIYAIPLWLSGLREIPQLTPNDFLKLLPIAALNAAGHTCAVIGMFEPGGGSLTHVIKASEPVVSVLFNLLINGVVPKPVTALTLLPITYGVTYASCGGNMDMKTMGKELSSKVAKLAMGSNVAFVLRSILRKNLNHEFKERTRLGPQNEHAVATGLSFLLMVPFVLANENLGKVFETIGKLPSQGTFWFHLIACSMAFYMYNELQNIVLGSLGAVPTAVGNTGKRVFIFIALYLFVEGETFNTGKTIGCIIAVLGCLAFAIADSKKI